MKNNDSNLFKITLKVILLSFKNVVQTADFVRATHFSFNKKPFIPPTAVSLKTARQGLGCKNIKNRQHITHKKINT